MNDLFIKKYFEDDDIMYYFHVKNRSIIRQIEIHNNEKILLSEENPVQGDSMLSDQEIDMDEFSADDFIKQEDFETVWNSK